MIASFLFLSTDKLNKQQELVELLLIFEQLHYSKGRREISD
jgi:hypothetical protein